MNLTSNLKLEKVRKSQLLSSRKRGAQMDWLQVENYMIVVEKDKTKEHYRNIELEQNEDYTLFTRHCLEDTAFVQFLQQFGVDQTKPVYLRALAVEQQTAIMFTGKFYFEGYLELGEYDLWDIVVGDAVLSFTNEDAAPFSTDNTSYVEISFEIVKTTCVKL